MIERDTIDSGESLGRLQGLFEEALRRPAADRPAFLADAAAGDEATRRRLEQMLAAHDRAELMLDRAPPGMAPAGDEAPAPATRESRPAHKEPEQIGPYRILEKLGEGGMGVVYKAEQKQPVRRLVALKVIKLGMDTKEVVARFEAERQALAMMNHPNVARVYEAGVTDHGRPYFAMEFVAGVPLVRYCDESRLTTKERLELFVQVCQAVQHAHQKGIIHRDLKPTNILVTHFDGKPVPKVIDFGIAKAANQALTDKTLYTRTGTLIGTPEYMSPEQALTSGLDVDTRTDVYSLGVILYELLTGTLPFDRAVLQRASLEQMAHIIKTVEPPRPSTRLSTLNTAAAQPEGSGSGGDLAGSFAPSTAGRATGGASLAEVASLRRCDPKALQRELRGDLDWIVLKAMEKDRTRRYETANGLAADVRRHLDNEPVQARPASALYKLRKFARRNKALAGAAAAVLLALLLGTAGTSVGLVRARAAQTRAETAQGHAQAAQGAAETAKTRAEAARLKAEAEVRTSRAVLDYTRRLLLSAQPDPKLNGLDLRVDDLLERAGKEIETTLKGQPEAEIEARVMLARMYFAVAGWFKSDKILEHLTRAYELSQALPEGAESERTLGLAAAVALYMPDAGRGTGETRELARRTYESARRKLGAAHPVTLLAAYAYGWSLRIGTRAGHPETEGLMRPVFEYAINQPFHATPPEMASVLSDYPHDLRESDRVEDAERAARRAMARLTTEPPGGAVANVRAQVGRTLAAALHYQGKRDEAVSVMADTLEYSKQHLGVFHPNTRLALHSYVNATQTADRRGDAEPVLERHLALARARFAGDDAILADALAELGTLWMGLGRQEQALTLLDEAVRMRRRLFGPSDPVAGNLLRSTLLTALGASRQPADGSWAAQIHCAIDAITRSNATDLPLPKDATASKVAYRLVRWHPPDHGSASQGTLADTAAAPLTPGIYLLSLGMPGAGSESPDAWRDSWVLVAPWQVSIKGIEPIPWKPGAPVPDFLTPTTRPVVHQTVPALAMVHRLKRAEGVPEEHFELTATTHLDLPAGRYRFSVTADDGARFYVNGRREISDWRLRDPTTNSCVLDLPAGRHELKVEYFQAGGGSALWVQAEPVSAAALSLRAASIDRELEAVSSAVNAKPDDVALLFRRAKLLGRASRFREAAQDFTRLVKLEPKEHWHWYQLACLLVYLGNDREYRSHCLAFLKQFPDVEGTYVLERSVKSALLLPGGLGGDVPELSRRAERLLADYGENPWHQHLMGLAHYRAGRFEAAIPWLQKCAAPEHTDGSAGRLASADALLAMAHHRLGHEPEARAALARCAERVAIDLPAVGAGDIEGYGDGIENWLIAHTLYREAEALILGQPKSSAAEDRPTAGTQ